jgi:hypothetical protein
VQEAAGAAVVGRGIERRRVARDVAPRQHRRQRPVVLVERQQRVPEAGERERVALADLGEHRPARTDELVGVVCRPDVRVAGLRPSSP